MRYGLVKFRQTCSFYICRLVNFRDGAIYRYRKTGKGVAGLLTRHSSSISFLVFFKCVIKTGYIIKVHFVVCIHVPVKQSLRHQKHLIH